MRIKSYVVVLLLIALLAGLVGCSGDSGGSAGALSPEQVVRQHFEYKNERNAAKAESLLVKGRRGIVWQFEKLNYIKLLKIEETKDQTVLDSYMKTGSGSALKPYAVKVFKVEFEVDYKGGFGSGMENGKYGWNYFVVKEKKDSPWLIHDWGV